MEPVWTFGEEINLFPQPVLCLVNTLSRLMPDDMLKHKFLPVLKIKAGRIMEKFLSTYSSTLC
jgi:hypothetical protein